MLPRVLAGSQVLRLSYVHYQYANPLAPMANVPSCQNMCKKWEPIRLLARLYCFFSGMLTQLWQLHVPNIDWDADSTWETHQHSKTSMLSNIVTIGRCSPQSADAVQRCRRACWSVWSRLITPCAAGAQQVLRNELVTHAVDLWALGCLIFQMLAGKPPFQDRSEYLTLERVAARDFAFPADMPPDATDLIDQLLVDEPSQRLGELLGHVVRCLQALADKPANPGSGTDIRAQVSSLDLLCRLMP